MLLIRNFLKNKTTHPGVIITLGNFDGVHIGHQKLIAKVKELAHEQHKIASVMSFEPHPSVFFNYKNKDYRILSFKEKFKNLKNLGIERLYLATFNNSFASLSAEEFVENILVKTLNISHIVVGYNFSFGHKREGNYEILKKLAKKHNFGISQIECQSDGKAYSSSAIRELLMQGKPEEASKQLGYQYYITGRVIKGKSLAITLGYPTANIKLHDLFRPRYGVYLINAIIEGDSQIYYGMANIGKRPTLDGVNELLEVHIFDFNQDLYGKNLKVELKKFIRDEHKFNNIEELVSQIKLDEINTRKLINENIDDKY
jgi:riboflavin kinase/FMN adenylyltransferase